MKTADQIRKIFMKSNHMNVFIVRKVSGSTLDPRGAHPGSKKKRQEGHLVLKAKLKCQTPVGKRMKLSLMG